MVTVDELLSQITTLQSQLEGLETKNKFNIWFLKQSNRLVIELPILYILLQIYYWPLIILDIFLEIIDSYIKILFTSWPAVILIISLLILTKYRETLNYLLTKRDINIRGVKITGANLEEQQKKGVIEIKEKTTKEITTPINSSVTSQDKDAIIEELKKDSEIWKALAEKANKEKIFERIYSFIFGSQIKILLEMTKNNGTIFVKDAFKFYVEGIGKNPELKGYDFVKYLYFLKNIGLIQSPIPLEDSSTITITEDGKEFLTYLALQKLEMNKPL